MDRDSADPRTTTTPPQPDTEPSFPMTPPGEHISVDVVPHSQLLQETGSEFTHSEVVTHSQLLQETGSEFTHSEVVTRSAMEQLSATQQSRLTPMESTKAKLPLKDGSNSGSNTTLQSMKRPEVTTTGATHTRRFMSIERDLEQMNATIKLLEKRCKRAENRVKMAWIAAAIAGALGLLGTVL